MHFERRRRTVVLPYDEANPCRDPLQIHSFEEQASKYVLGRTLVRIRKGLRLPCSKDEPHAIRVHHANENLGMLYDGATIPTSLLTSHVVRLSVLP